MIDKGLFTAATLKLPLCIKLHRIRGEIDLSTDDPKTYFK